VGRKHVREQIISTTRLQLGSGEHIRSVGPVWATECGGRVPLLFRGRDLHYVAVTDRRLILFRAPRRRRPLAAENMLIAKRHPSFTLEKTRRFSPLLQLRVRDASGRRIALEFRPRDRKVGRELATMLGTRRALPRYT
jgi:hypothetical protein